MFAKMLLIILSAGAIASSLLVLRQQKVETIHEISQAYHRQRQYQRTLWQLQAEIARRCRPEALRDMLLQQQADWKPIPAFPSTLDPPSDEAPEALPGEAAEALANPETSPRLAGA